MIEALVAHAGFSEDSTRLMIRLVLAPVCARIGVGMTVPAVGFGLDKAGTFRLASPSDRLCHRPSHRHHIHAIHHYTWVSTGAISDIGQLGDLCPGNRHGIHAVFDNEDHRQTPGAGQIEAFVEISRIGRAIAEEAQNDPIAPLQLLRPRRPDRYGDIPSNDACGSRVSMRDIGNVHRSALALIMAARAATTSAIIRL